MALLAFCVSGTTLAQTAPAICTPYSIPIQSTVTECGPGMVGSKYKTSTKTCPDGKVVESLEFDTSNCMTVSTGTNGVMTAEARCRLTPGACANAPIAANCPAGRKWSLMGSGVAHCVDLDPACVGGTVNHDSLGNPTNCQTSATRTRSCGTGYTGSIRQRRAVYKWMDGTTTYGTWRTYSDTCDAVPPPPPPEPEPTPTPTPTPTPSPTTCSAGSSTESAQCTGGRGGSMTRTVTTSCPGGSYGSPSTSYGSWDESKCTATCSPSSSTYSTACGTGYTGTKYITTHYTCPSGSYNTTNDDGCGCANGATNYPTCTPPYQEPAPKPQPPSGCLDIYGTYLPVGTIASNCDVGGGNPYPRGRTYRCTSSGWATANAGSSVSVYCE